MNKAKLKVTAMFMEHKYNNQCFCNVCSVARTAANRPINIPQVPKDALVPIITNEQIAELYKDLDLKGCVMDEKGNIGYTTKDSGQRETFASGMQRDIQTDKPRYDLIGWGWKLIKRWAELVGRGAIKYGELNFEKANSHEELNRFKASALRHMIQWYMGETEEDHAAAVCFNLAGAEALKEKLNASQDK